MTEAPAPVSIPIPPLPGGWWRVGFTVLADGSVAVLAADIDLLAEWRVAEGLVAPRDPWGAASKAMARLWSLTESGWTDGPSFPLLTPLPMVDRFPDGRWLVASARTLEKGNARILTPEGTEIRRLHLGDGIMHLKIDEAGLIWVGWFDEGVFGNDGWRVSGLEWPPSAYGLAAFDEDGGVVAHAEPPAQEGAIADCYALNVAGRTALACTYGDFPIISISAEGQTWIPTELSGSRALAVRWPHVLAVGGYEARADRAVLLRLEGEEAKTIGEWRMPFLLGYPESVELIDGRGEWIHVVNDGLWSRWPIQDFLQAAGLE